MSTMTAEKRQSITARQRKAPRVHLEFIDPVAGSVCLAGTFNDWRPNVTPMIHIGAGRWVKALALPPGSYEYRLVVDGEWKPAPRAGETIANPFCGFNSVLEVSPPVSPKLALTIVCEALAREHLTRLLAEAGVFGYTMFSVQGTGAKGSRVADIDEFGNIQIEVIVPAPVAKRLLECLRRDVLPHFAVIVYETEVWVLRSDKF